MEKIYTVGIVGGGVSGVVTALQLANYHIDSVLFEKKESVVNGPPFCHLHAGGNLYLDISDEQCKILMKQSIEMARLFPQSIDERPTFISIPKTEKYEVAQIEKRLDVLVSYYKSLIDEDPANEVLGAPEDYYKAYTKEDLDRFVLQPSIKRPNTPDEWITNSVHWIDYEKLKMPVILVQEYGWNLFRLGAQAQLALIKATPCDLKLNTPVVNIKDVRDQKLAYNWEICTNEEIYKVKFLVNSCGFKTGEIDQTLQLKSKRLIEFKAAYVSLWKPIPGLIPEFIFHGERGTTHGMAQLTPYCDDYYQIHGMTTDITLFDNGLVQSKEDDVQPEFDESINQKLSSGWEIEEIKTRTKKGIEYISQFVPNFSSATVGGAPMFGAQQIPGDDITLRVGEVSFPSPSYARIEIIKASSALTVANQIIQKIQEEEHVPLQLKKSNQNRIVEGISKEEIDKMARTLTLQRGYPEAMSRLIINPSH
jgi:L-2-hydroxyglutarate oxidase LhgO